MGNLYIIVKSVQVTVNVDIVQGDLSPDNSEIEDKFVVECEICGRWKREYTTKQSANRALAIHQSQHCKGYPPKQNDAMDLVNQFTKRRKG